MPRVLLSDGTEPTAETIRSGSTESTLSGTPASAGIVTAQARVILDPTGAHLEPGEILVAPSTDPGWTPLFLTAGGLVMEMGGAMSHGAVVAREFGIPAVVGDNTSTDTLWPKRHIIERTLHDHSYPLDRHRQCSNQIPEPHRPDYG